jgi:hypothetical protein
MPWFRIKSHVKHGNKRASFVRIYQNREEACKAWKSNAHVSFMVEAIEAPTLQEWWDFLNRHDWNWGMSDDSSAYRRGAIADAVLQSTVPTLPKEHQDLHHQFCLHAYWDWKGERPAKPERPSND